MNTANQFGTAPTNAADEIARLRTMITDADWMQQDALEQIECFARLGLMVLEMPEALRFPGFLAALLAGIRDRADDTRNYLNAEAERVGCNYKDEKRLSRLAAWRAAHVPPAAARGC